MSAIKPQEKATPFPVVGRQPGRRRAARLVVQQPTELEAVAEAPVHIELETPVVPNVDYLGRGWDILTLDPRQLGKAPGQKIRMIFDINSQNTVLTPDARWRVPKGTFYAPGTDGSEASQATSLYTSWDFQERFKEVATAEVGIPGLFTFSASATYESFREQSTSQESMSTFTQAQVDSLSLGLNLDGESWNPDLSLMSGFQQFRERVDALPTTQGAAYTQLIQDFGTHFSRGVTFGGRAYQTVQVHASAYETLTSEKVNLDVAAKGTFEGVTVGGGSSTGSESQKKFDQATKDYQSAVVFSGGVPNTNFNSWFASVSSNPAPIKLDLVPLYNLLNQRWFPADGKIDTKRTLLQIAINTYLQTVGRTSQLSFTYARDFKLAWRDKGSGANLDGAFYAPVVPRGYFAVATYGQKNYKSPTGPSMLLTQVAAGAGELLKAPTGFKQIWKDEGLGDSVPNGSFYRPTPPGSNYVSMSDWAVAGRNAPPTSAVMCLHSSVVAAGKLGEKIWSTNKTKAKTKAAIFRIVPADDKGLDVGGIYVSTGSIDKPSKEPTLWVPAKRAF